MDTPESVMTIARQMAAKFPADIPRAVNETEAKVKALPDYEDFVSILVRRSLQDVIYEVRHEANRQTRYAAGQYGGPAKTVAGDSVAVKKAMKSLYNYHIAGTVLGLLHGEDLLPIAESEQARANGHSFNARLCTKLNGMVPKTKRVQDAVSASKLMGVFQSMEAA